MQSDLRTQKRPRNSVEKAIDETIMSAPELDVPTYVSKFKQREKFEDVVIDKNKIIDESAMIMISNPTDDMPFKQVDFEESWQDLMETQWKDNILIKVLGNSWFYPALVTKLDTLWNLHGVFDLVDLGHNCYLPKRDYGETNRYDFNRGSMAISRKLSIH